MGRRKYKEGYTESITAVCWLLFGIPMLLLALLGLFSKKKK